MALPDGVLWQGTFLGYKIAPFAVDKLSRLFALVFAVMAFGGGLFALKQAQPHGGARGLCLRGRGDRRDTGRRPAYRIRVLGNHGGGLHARDLERGNRAAYRASMRYAMVHLLGGVLLMAGIVGHVATTGSTLFERIALDAPAHWLILAGFLVNAGRRRCPRGCRMPIPRPRGAARCFCRPSRRRPRYTC